MSEKEKGPLRPDWRDVEQYRHLLDLDRAGWAWEWLRRSPDYAGEGGDEGKKSTRDLSVQSEPVLLRPASRGYAYQWGLCFCRDTLLPRHAGAAPLGRAV